MVARRPNWEGEARRLAKSETSSFEAVSRIVSRCLEAEYHRVSCARESRGEWIT